MPKRKDDISSQDPMECDFIDAIARLRDGKPRNKELRTKAKEGILKINATNVALEAGHSRTFISLKDCRYPTVRALLAQYKKEKNSGDSFATTHTELINKLRYEKAQLIAKVKSYQAEAAVHFLARKKVEKLLSQDRATAARKARNSREQVKVVPIVQSPSSKP